MSGPDDSAENFLQRWSRRKLEARTSEPEAEGPGQPGAGAVMSPITAAPAKAVRPAFDPASLPPIESINASTNISAFLAPGVPGEITRAALRRAWAADPAIRDFVGLAENQWDFTKPDGVPGFGALELTPELRRMVARLVGDAAAEAETLPTSAETDQARIDPAEELGDTVPAAAARAEEASTGAALVRAPGQRNESDETAVAPRRLPDDAADPARQGQTDGFRTVSRHRHGRAVPRLSD